MSLYRTNKFVTAGSHSLTIPAGVTTVYYLIAGGGAGGNAANNGPGTAAFGGGGGQVMQGSITVSAGLVLSMSVGAGGSTQSNGGNTTITATGISVQALGGYTNSTSRGYNNAGVLYSGAVSTNAYSGTYGAGTGGNASTTAAGAGVNIQMPDGVVYSNLGTGGSLLTGAKGTPYTGSGGAGGALGRKYDQYGADIGANVDQYGNVGSYQTGGAGSDGIVILVYAVDYSSKSLTLGAVQQLFGGSSPTNISEYYAGGGTGYVPAGTVGYPNNVSTNIPSSGPISLSNFEGTSAYVFWSAQYSNSVNTGVQPPTAATTAYFGGSIGANYAWLTRNSNTAYMTFSTPDNGQPGIMTLSGGGGYIGVGYRYYTSCGLYGCSTNYYYDRMKSPGYRVYNSGGVLMGESRSSDASQVNWTVESNGNPVYRDFGSGFTFNTVPGETYSLYYVCDFYGETGLDYFYFSGYSVYASLKVLQYIA